MQVITNVYGRLCMIMTNFYALLKERPTCTFIPQTFPHQYLQ